MYAGIDLGANFGFAVLDEGGNRLYSATTHLKKRTAKSLARFQQTLYDFFETWGVIVIGYEAVKQHHKSRAAACAYGSYEGILLASAFTAELEVVPVGVWDIKRMTGIPKPQKIDMEAYVKRRHNYITADDNEADALMIAEFARLKFIRGAA